MQLVSIGPDSSRSVFGLIALSSHGTSWNHFFVLPTSSFISLPFFLGWLISTQKNQFQFGINFPFFSPKWLTRSETALTLLAFWRYLMIHGSVCGPRFESRAQHLCFFQFKLNFDVKRTKTNNKKPWFAIIKKNKVLIFLTNLGQNYFQFFVNDQLLIVPMIE